MSLTCKIKMHNIIYFKENRFWIPLTNTQMKTCTYVNWNYLNCTFFSCKRGFNAEQKVTMPMHLTDKGRQWEAETKEPEGEVGSTFILKPRRLLLSIIQKLSIQHSQLPFIECQAYFRSFLFSKWSWLRGEKSQSCWRKVPWGWQSLQTGLPTAPGGHF